MPLKKPALCGSVKVTSHRGSIVTTVAMCYRVHPSSIWVLSGRTTGLPLQNTNLLVINEEMLARLNRKYGSAKIIRGKFISDNEYLWQKDGINITFKFDWQNYRTRLSYVSPDAFRQLKLERLTVEQDESAGKLTQDLSAY